MKTYKLLAVALLLFASSTIEAQVSVNVNIGRAPQWGPVGYNDVSYYYIPDIEAYYDVRATQFIYFGDGRWVRSRTLPYRYRNFDLYRGYKVVLTDYRGSRPYANFKTHKVKYYHGYKGRPQHSRGRNDRDVYVTKTYVDKRKYYDRDHDRGRGHDDHRKGGRGHDNHDRGGRGHDRD